MGLKRVLAASNQFVMNIVAQKKYEVVRWYFSFGQQQKLCAFG